MWLLIFSFVVVIVQGEHYTSDVSPESSSVEEDRVSYLVNTFSDVLEFCALKVDEVFKDFDILNEPEIQKELKEISHLYKYLNVVKKENKHNRHKNETEELNVNDIFQHTNQIIRVLNESCSSLKNFGSTSKVVSHYLLKWAYIWVRRLDREVNAFIDSCTKSYVCEELLDNLIRGIVLSFQEYDEQATFENEILVEDKYKNTKQFWNLLDDIWNPFQKLRNGKYLNRIYEYWSDTGKQAVGSINVLTETVVSKVPDVFLSITLSPNLLNHWNTFHDQLDKIKKLSQGLSPAILRFGGSEANFVTYNLESLYSSHPKYHGRKGLQKHPKFKEAEEIFKNLSLTANIWQEIVSISSEFNWTILFDLNQFSRDNNGQWDPTNARHLIEKVSTTNGNVIWQLGNEPNAYKHKFGVTISPTQAAEDFKALRAELERFIPLVILVGPDVTRPKPLVTNSIEEEAEFPSDVYLEEFLKMAVDVIDVVSWHQYYVDGKTATLEEFCSLDVMKKFSEELLQIRKIKDQFCPEKQIWLTETGSAWGGGAPDLSDTFVGGFLWLDKLGISALNGVSVVARQTFYGGNYGLLDASANPNPDYWISVLYKDLVGNEVFEVSKANLPDTIRLYAHCVKRQSKFYSKGSLVVFGFNLGDDTTIKVEGQMSSSLILQFILSSENDNLQSKNILLNGKIVQLTESGEMPEILPQEDNGGELHMTSYTMAFWVFPQANVDICF